MRWIGITVLGVIVATVLAFPSLDRLQARAEESVGPGWVKSEVFREGGVPVVGPRANVTISAVMPAEAVPSDLMLRACPGSIPDSSPGGATTGCSAMTMDVEAVLVTGPESRITVTAYRRESWLLIPALVGLCLGVIAVVARKS